jgi:hypothetical protein
MPSIINATTTGGVVVSGDNSGSLQLASNNGTTAVTINGSQNVGIGTTSPASKLDVFADTVTFGDTGSFNFAINGTNVLFKNGSGGTTECMRITSAGDLRFNSGYGSVAVAYGCRAWVNFNGSGTIAIRGSGNVSSITDNGTGDYTVNFTTAMPDANYAASISVKPKSDSKERPELDNLLAASIRVINDAGLNDYYDTDFFTVAIFR